MPWILTASSKSSTVMDCLPLEVFLAGAGASIFALEAVCGGALASGGVSFLLLRSSTASNIEAMLSDERSQQSLAASFNCSPNIQS